MRKFYISDWHYGHGNIIRLDNRPFSSVEEMNKTLVDNWNRVVTNADTVYVVGDMFWCKSAESVEVLKRLKGNKFLIKGNHDRSNDNTFKKQFVKITEYMEVEDNGNKIVLCHYPIPCFKNHFYGWKHFYGHVHTTKEYELTKEFQQKSIAMLKAPCDMYNIGAMMPWMDYTPRTAEEIIKHGE